MNDRKEGAEHMIEKNKQERVRAFREIEGLLKNNPLELSEKLFERGPAYKPAELAPEIVAQRPVSFIIGEHPSEYSVSPLMWNAEYRLRGAEGLFLPADIPWVEKQNLETLLSTAFSLGKKLFRVLTITNPYKVDALNYYQRLAESQPERITVSDDAMRIGATNQILVGPDDVFHVINSDGRGMVRSVESFLRDEARGNLLGKRVGLVGAGGAARGIAYEVLKRLSGAPGGTLSIFNRTKEKALSLAGEFGKYFPDTPLKGHGLEDLVGFAKEQDVIVSSITEGDPFLANNGYAALSSNTLMVDANYGTNSVMEAHARAAGRNDLKIRDGAGMVVEGYIIPSRELAHLWGYAVPEEIYQKIGKLFGYEPMAASQGN